ncbi:ABC transporter ATP-binding protein [Devosia geojensis]|uniref:ABC transporter ATP-binding protein n=1 Tax=Devosia geojensis TaxID=443610 RepID=A0A0F5FU66_9HYPH|nr:sn-glycerol-3-phosphate ABC transporter ATP-binding protein UgpC [Devosia geojensis]KKB11717.1 ABC transporter ATP-binding protein [Devosia geojensis]
MAGLALKNIHKSFGKVDVIKGVDLTVEHGEFVVFVGPSGCGKSTLLRMIAGLEDITDGELWIGDKLCNEVQPRDRRIAMVFQSYALYPHMTAYENVGFGLTLAKTPKAERDAKIREAARILQMEHLLDRKPAQLSGGQRQRVAIGRAIVRNPEVFLFDEPLSNLDAALRMDMRMELSKLHQDLGATMIYVTHDQVEAMTLADKIVVLNGGIVQQVGTPMELYHRPANLFVATFIGSPKMNLIEVEVKETASGMITVGSQTLDPVAIPAIGAVKPGDTLTLGLRSHHLTLGGEALTGTVALVERLGNETIVNLEVAGGNALIAALDGDTTIERGSSLSLGFAPQNAILFDASGRALDEAVI